MTETLDAIARVTAEELTRIGIAPSQRCYVYASHLVELGMRLNDALDESHPDLRPDVMSFASVMSRMMDAKESEHKQPVMLLQQALAQIQMQMRKFEDAVPFCEQDKARILVHIANWCMLGFQLLSKYVPDIF